MTDPIDRWQPGEGFYFERGGIARVGIGARQTIIVPSGGDQVARAAVLAREALAGTDGVVVGALPFGSTSPATLVIPETFEVLKTEPGGPSVPAEGSFTVTPVPDPSTYRDAVRVATEAIRRRQLDKVVLARMLMVQSDHVFDRQALLRRLRAAEPEAFVFAAAGFIGASPELLVSRHGDRVVAHPLAGTAARVEPGAPESLLRSAKDLAEHAFVVDAVVDGLSALCDDVTADGPHIVSMSRLHHLATRIEGRLKDPATNALDLAGALHPTPAVCGTPRKDALAALAELESIDRTLYGGIVGWMDASGDGEWAIVLRCAEIAGRIGLLFAGAGIVAESDPEAELAETDAKFLGMLEALGYA